MTPRRLARLGPRAMLGAGLVIRPRAVLRVVQVETASRTELYAARALGLRHLIETGCLLTARGRTARAVQVIDRLHVASMLALGLASRLHRRLALTSALVGTLLTALLLPYERVSGP